jgi:hypothetical protein
MDFVRGHEMLAYAYYSTGAHLYWDLEQPDEAAPWFARALEENPRSANTYYALSRVHYDRAEKDGGRSDLALSRAFLDRALRLEPEHPQALRHLERLREHGAYASQGGGPAARGLRAEVATLFERLDREQGVPRLGEALTQGIQGARIRGIGAYEHSILRYGEPAFDLEKLRGGQLPYLSKGDFDCDGTEDQAVLLDEPARMVALRLGNGTTKALPGYDGDVLETGSPGSVVTAAGKGIGSPAPGTPERFEARCDFVSVRYWGRSSYAVVFEPESGSFQRFWTSD